MAASFQPFDSYWRCTGADPQMKRGANRNYVNCQLVVVQIGINWKSNDRMICPTENKILILLLYFTTTICRSCCITMVTY